MENSNFEKRFFWVCMFLMLLLVLSVVHVYAETVSIEGNSITITGTAKKAANKAYFERLKRAEALHLEEIKRKHEMDIEAAKFANALKLEEAGASQIFVSSYSSSSTSVKNSIEQENENNA